MIYVILSFAVAILLVYLYIKNKYNYWEQKGVQNLKPTFPFGNLTEKVLLRKAFGNVLQDQYNHWKDKRYYGMYQFLTPIFIIKDLELIKAITIKDFDSFVDHQNHARDDVDPLWSRNVFSMRGEAWRDMRGTLSPAFTGSKMRLMFTLMDDCAKRFTDHFFAYKEDVIKLEMKDTFTRVTNDIIASCAFGVSCNSLAERENEFYMLGKKTFDFSGIRQLIFFMYSSCPKLMKLLGLKFFNDDISNFFTKLIKETIAYREQKGITRPDMIHLLLEARKGQLKYEDNLSPAANSFETTQTEYHSNNSLKGKWVELTDEDITAQALVFFFGGFDTTSFLMCFASYELAIHTDIQDRLRKEINDVYDECKGKLDYEHLMKMKYLDMVMSETLRKWPPAVILDRLCTKEYTIKAMNKSEKDVTLPVDSVLMVPAYAIHRDPAYFPDPDKFDPERFSSENKSKINPFTYMPFGIGPRNCIGFRFALMENKAVIFHLLRRFEIVPIKETPIPLKLCKKQVMVAAEGGFWLGLKKLNN